MGFNSFEFFLFLPVVFYTYWYLARTYRSQNLLLLIASYIFYGLWDWRFLILITLSSAADFILGKEIFKYRKTNRPRAKRLLWLSLVINLGLLGFFKYFDFFVQSFVILFSTLGIHLDINTLNIILPVGISFYTFQTMSYSIDIYRKKIKPTSDPVLFFTFVSFFPQLVAGPIERASKMLPQFEVKREFDLQKSVEGLKFILYGLFKKIVVADYCAKQANAIFNNYEAYGGSDLVLGVLVYFPAQLYADFSAYSEIAIGCGLLFGVQLSRNFAYPFFSKNLEEFWQRWHITLTNWFRDYVFLSLRRGIIKHWSPLILTSITFGLIGLWHGANYTFVLWGLLNGFMYLVFTQLKRQDRIRVFNRRSELHHWPYMMATSFLICSTVLIFRSPSIGDAFHYLMGILSPSLFTIPETWQYLFWPTFLGVWEWNFRDHWHGLKIDHLSLWKRWSIYIAFILVTMYHFGLEKEFIYFQF